jgi:oligo-1,6-glucosidase
MRDVESIRYYRTALALGLDADSVWRGLQAMGRDNARTPMQWDGTEHAGFTTGDPWLAVNPNHGWLNAERQYDDEASVFNHYRRLIDLRHTLAVVVEGDFTMLVPEDRHVYAFTRRLGDEELTVVANLSGDRVPCPVVVSPGIGEFVLRSYPDDGDRETLRPWEAWVHLGTL